MAINFFRTLDAVLSQAVAEICRVERINVDEAIDRAKKFLIENSAAYYSDDPQLQYNHPLCRVAYLYTYVGAHANLVDNAFYKFPQLKAFVEDQIRAGTLHICSLGGGPGSELLGLVKFIERERALDDRVDIHFSLIDNIFEWDETWNALVNGLEATFEAAYGLSRRDWPIVVHRSFLPLDLIKVQQFHNLPTRFRNTQIFVFNHTVSELRGHKDAFFEVFNKIVERASDGAYFLFIDVRLEVVMDMVAKVIHDESLTHLGTIEEETNMDQDEQKTDLGEWYIRMRRRPKVSWDAFYTLAQKLEDDF